MSLIGKASEAVLDITKGQSGKMLERVLGPMFDEIGLTLAESVRGWRLKKQIKLLQDAEEYIEKKGIKTKQVSLKNLTPLLEHASLEEEETLQDNWKNMLINYADAEQNFNTNLFPFILSQLSFEEFQFFEQMESDGVYLPPKKKAIQQVDLILENLRRLGLVELDLSIDDKLDTRTEKRNTIHDTERLTPLSQLLKLTHCYFVTEIGHLFISACRLREE